MEAEDDLVIPGRAYIKPSSVGAKPTLLVFFEEGDCVAYYPQLDLFKYFFDPTVQNVELADPETERTFLMDVRRAIFNAIQVRAR